MLRVVLVRVAGHDGFHPALGVELRIEGEDRHAQPLERGVHIGPDQLGVASRGLGSDLGVEGLVVLHDLRLRVARRAEAVEPIRRRLVPGTDVGEQRADRPARRSRAVVGFVRQPRHVRGEGRPRLVDPEHEIVARAPAWHDSGAGRPTLEMREELGAGLVTRPEQPSTADVVMIVPGLRTPRITAHSGSPPSRRPRLWVEPRLQEVRDLLRQALLDLQAAGIRLDHARDLGQADDPSARDIRDRRRAEERQEVVLAQRVERDVLDDHHLAVVDIEDRPLISRSGSTW
jgi:hypothetical protein